MRFLADENVSRLVVERLRADGHEVVSIVQIEPGAPDKTVLRTADVEGRILITEDRDFGELVVRQHMAVRCVLLLELDRLTNRAEADRVSHVVSTYAEKLMDNLAVIEPSRLRLRPLRG
jgi:predicted nuclease of predicted toxin-antitoxin system